VQRAKYVLDVGANSGLYSIIAGVSAPRARIDAFEPYPPAVACLEANLRLNGITEKVSLIRVAVGDYTGEATLYVPTGDYGDVLERSSSLDPSFRPQHSERLSVRVITLDDHLKTCGLGMDSVDVLRVDVESLEPAVLRGARAMLEGSRPVVILEVTKHSDLQALEAERKRLGYLWAILTETSLVRERAVEVAASSRDHLLLPPGKWPVVEKIAGEMGLMIEG